MPILALAPLGALAISKRAKNRKKQAAANVYSQKYPLLDNYASMQSSISAAQADLATINAAPAKTRPAKQTKKRNQQTLGSWISVMKAHLKDLQMGVQEATTQTVVESAQNAVVSPTSSSSVASEAASVTSPSSDSSGDMSVAETTSPIQKKGVNWIWVGAGLVGAVIVYKLIVKNK